MEWSLGGESLHVAQDDSPPSASSPSDLNFPLAISLFSATWKLHALGLLYSAHSWDLNTKERDG